MRLTIEKIVYPGRRLAVWDGRTIFTDEGLPGEVVEVESVREHKNYLEAKTVRILSESPARVQPRCGHYQACGAYQTLSYELQIQVKTDQLREILDPGKDSGIPDPEFVAAPAPWHYRNKARFKVIRESGRVSLAYHAPGSENEYIAVEECHLISKSSQALLSAVLEVAGRNGILSLDGVEAKESRANGELLLNLFWSDEPRPADVDFILSGLLGRFPLVGVHSFRTTQGRTTFKTEWGRDFIVEQVSDNSFEVGAATFFQVHTAMLERVLAEIASVPGINGARRIADLYCGVGTFGIALARGATEVDAVESDPSNIAFLKKNIRNNGLDNVRIHEGRSEDWADWILEKPVEAAVCDPPRKGLHPALVRAFLTHRPRRIIYISCNPTTLVRDLKALGSVYAVEKLKGFDFFPQTPHIETLAVLVSETG